MRIDVPAREVLRQSFWLGAASDGTPGIMREPRMGRLADCIAALRPAIAAAGRDYDDRCLVLALTAITAHLAAEADDAQLASTIFRSCARLLELADALPTADAVPRQ